MEDKGEMKRRQTHADGLEINISGGDLGERIIVGGRRRVWDRTSKEVPKMLSLTKDMGREQRRRVELEIKRQAFVGFFIPNSRHDHRTCFLALWAAFHWIFCVQEQQLPNYGPSCV